MEMIINTTDNPKKASEEAYNSKYLKNIVIRLAMNPKHAVVCIHLNKTNLLSSILILSEDNEQTEFCSFANMCSFLIKVARAVYLLL